MIGEFLAEVTMLHAAIYFAVNLIVLFLIARYKPTWYNSAYRISLALILFVAVYRMGWSASATHHAISLGNQSQLLDTSFMFFLLIVLHYVLFEKVAEKRIDLEEDVEV